MEYFQKAIECDSPEVDAYYPLGMGYLHGDGVPVDKEKAKIMFKKGSQLGNEDCTEEYNRMVKRAERIETAKKIGSTILEGILTVGAAYGQAYLNSLNNNDDNSY